MAYHKAPPDYPLCPACHRHTAVNYIGQIQKGMRGYSCARCKVLFFFWGSLIKMPRPFVDRKGKVYKLKEL